MEDVGIKEIDTVSEGGLQRGVMNVFTANSGGGKSLFDKPAPDAYKGQTRPITDFMSHSSRYGYGGPSGLGFRMLQNFIEGGGTVLYFDTECSLSDKDFERMAERLGFKLLPK